MTEAKPFTPAPLIATELKLDESHVATVIRLLDEGNTVPFIARYRKEMTGSLDDVQIHAIEERRAYLTDLDKRRQTVLSSIEEQGKLTEELKVKIAACTTKAALEDLYLPYKPKRRTRAMIAREKGLEPLANRILEQPSSGDPLAEGAAFVDGEKGVDSADAALAGARDIIAEVVAENADFRSMVRDKFANSGVLVAVRDAKATEEATKYSDYYDYQEPAANIPSHRFLAVRRGEKEGVLRYRIEVDADPLAGRMKLELGLNEQSPFAEQLSSAVDDAYQRLIGPSVENDVRVEMKMRADRSAVEIFADNLRNLLLAAPLGGKRVLGVDPGLRTGCKCAALDETGKFLDNLTIYLVKGDHSLDKARQDLLAMMQKHQPATIAVGNGTGGRETEKFIRRILKEQGLDRTDVVQVNEAGASVYSASKTAQQEFPELDVTVRGAISIGRRLQDPLAELVKIEPKSIGVGQYQHDVHQPLLTRKLNEVVESCVNHVGVELNTASVQLLSQVSGIGPGLATNIVQFREQNGAFESRKQLLKVPKLGPRTFEQAAGFLRIRGAANPLDASAVHPERYRLVNRIAGDMSVSLGDLVGDAKLVETIELKRYIDDEVGEPTLRDILDELKKPGRDPRQQFEAMAFRDDVETVADLKKGMTLDGVVTNVTAFGAFVDVGVHRDGLVHISQLADRFVKDPNEVVKVGDRIKVHVIDVDLDRERISLSARSQPSADAPSTGSPPAKNRQQGRPAPGGGRPPAPRKNNKFSYNPFADLLKK